MQEISTPDCKTIEEITSFFDVTAERCLKTIIVKGTDTPFVALVLRGDHSLNEVKVEKLQQVAAPLQLASDEEVAAVCGCKAGFVGPIGLSIPIIIDRSAAHCANFICGANKTNHHLKGVNWLRDCPLSEIADLRLVVDGDLSPDGHGKLQLVRGIEAGHIFQLGDKYSKPMNATYLDKNGKANFLQMGCYGLGVSRVVAATIEQNHDDKGIIWPDALAPFKVVLVPIGYHKSPSVKQITETFYQQLSDANVEVLLDDRNERPGIMFADMDLIGIPHRIVIGEKNLQQNLVEYKNRRTQETKLIPTDEIVSFVQQAQ